MKPRKPQAARRSPGSKTLPEPGSAPRLVHIEKPIYGGAFLARDEGKAIMTPLTLAGEQARVRIVDDRRGYAFAEAEEIVSAAPERVEPRCPYFGACGGCDYQHARYDTQLAIKQAVLRETLERAGVQPPETIDVLSAEPWAYRNRIRLAFDAAGKPAYRARRSHGLIAIRECPIAAPLLVEAALAAADVARESASPLRPAEISLFCNAEETSLLVSVILAQASKSRVDDFARALVERIPALAGVEFVTEGLAGRQPRTIAQWGATSLTYHAAGFDYRVDHGAFFQVNRWLVDALVERVVDDHPGRLAWDLFAGVGLFARQLARAFEQLVAIESAPAAIPALEANLNGTSGAAVRATTLDFLRANTKNERPDLVVVDPPRTGLGAEIATLLAAHTPPELVYVSCDPATLARDLRELIASGYTMESLALADLFPHTFHVETVVRLRRA
jgi:23S rRNA (uracil1939-C5)-methyltransferase